MIRTAVLLTVYNRREVTLQGLRSLYKAIEKLGGNYIFDIYMTDDGCTDGTAEAVIKEFPDVVVVQGDGNLFWNRGMLKAWKAAESSNKSYDFFLWYNDDNKLYENGLLTLYESSYKNGKATIVSGAFCDENGFVSYGGWNRKVLVTPNCQLQQVEKINGNLVLIPKEVFDKIGMLDGHFHHSYGDWEYGIRARKAGIQLIITPSFLGVCKRHESIKKCYDPNVRVLERISNLYSPNGVCPSNVFYYYRKCCGFPTAVKNWLFVHLNCLFLIKKL